MSKPVYVLGTGLSHDGSSCLLKDGQIIVAIEKDRLSRRKHDGGNDEGAGNPEPLVCQDQLIAAAGQVLNKAQVAEAGEDLSRGPRPGRNDLQPTAQKT